VITAFQAVQLTVLGARSDSNRILKAICEAAAAEDDFCYVMIPSRREDELPLGEENDQIRAYIEHWKIKFSSAGLSESVDSGLEMRGLTIIDLKDAIQRHV